MVGGGVVLQVRGRGVRGSWRKVYDVLGPKNAYLSVLKSYGWVVGGGWWGVGVYLDYNVSSLPNFLFSFFVFRFRRELDNIFVYSSN